MALKIAKDLAANDLVLGIHRLFELSAAKILSLEKSWNARDGAPVFTVRGRYASRGWTEWTQGFQFGSALLQFDATGDNRFLELGRKRTIERMAPHVSHTGVHDHGFNNISTYGNLWRLIREGRIPFDERENDFCELALKVSGATQAARWSRTADGGGFIYSFNGPHSLFVDTIRSLRSLAVAHQLGHVLMAEHDERISLLERLVLHAIATAQHSIFYGEGRDLYDVRGRTAHEIIFNPNAGQYRCPNSQQGYSPFSTWTRGLAWAILGFAELLEFLNAARKFSADWSTKPGRGPELSRALVVSILKRAALATADFYLQNCCTDGIPAWDTGAPNLGRLGNYLDRPSDPFNKWEPMDSSAAAIAAQGFVRLGNYLRGEFGAVPTKAHYGGGERTPSPPLEERARERRPPSPKPSSQTSSAAGAKYRQAGLTIARTLLAPPYLSTNPRHQGLLLHSVYHRPNAWDYVAPGQRIPNGESSMWGDYHLRELAVLLLREARKEPYPTFFA